MADRQRYRLRDGFTYTSSYNKLLSLVGQPTYTPDTP